jgi:arylsulfatase A-like enzyme
LVAKIAAAVLLADPWLLAPNVIDVLVVALLVLASGAWPRTMDILGAIIGLYAIFNVVLVGWFGSPLTAPMLAYAGDARVGAPVAGAPLVATVIAFLVFGAGAAALWRRPIPYARARAIIPLAAVVALVSAGARRDLGLRDNPIAAFVLSLHTATAAERVAFDAPIDVDAALHDPVDIDDTQRPKHVVIWLAESVGARHTSLFPGGHDTTPRLQKLREHALLFDRWSANAPISAKAIFTTLCGLYPLPEPALETHALPRVACPSLMETLSAEGFDAALLHGGYFAFTDKLAFLEERGFQLLMDGASVPDRDRWFTNGWGVDDAALVAHGLAWLDARPDPSKRTLAVYIPLVPHYEYWMPPNAPLPFGTMTLQARYHNGIAYTDALFGEVVDGYEARGILDDTLFVFLGDHGEAFEEHPRNKLHAAALYEENVHVPALFVSTRLFHESRTSSRPASHVDLVPTVLALLGVSAPAGLQGQSLLGDAWLAKPVMLGTWYPDAFLGLRAGDVKYLRHLQDGAEELYDLARDPLEKTNIAALFPDHVRAHRGRVLDFAECQRTFLLALPTKGPTFLDRAVAAMKASDDSTLAIVRDKAFNMEQRCLRVRPPRTGTLVLTTTTSPPVRVVGIGLTDSARAARGDPVHARFTSGGRTVALEVNDVFETTSKVRDLEAADAQLTIEIDAAAGRNRSVCVTLAPW